MEFGPPEGGHYVRRCAFRNLPVCDALHLATSSGVPATTTVAAGVAALGTEIDDVIGSLNHIEMVLDEQHRMPGIDQTIERFEQPLHVCQVQSGRRLIEDVERVLRTLQRCSARWRS